MTEPLKPRATDQGLALARAPHRPLWWMSGRHITCPQLRPYVSCWALPRDFFYFSVRVLGFRCFFVFAWFSQCFGGKKSNCLCMKKHNFSSSMGSMDLLPREALGKGKKRVFFLPWQAQIYFSWRHIFASTSGPLRNEEKGEKQVTPCLVLIFLPLLAWIWTHKKSNIERKTLRLREVTHMQYATSQPLGKW